ncbi:MAG TPA: 2Fe-2S iron-sulfur cluster-binding protein [Desulfatiglandales bacterium]|nr:2Fe-2S iron-sulfur cluster-binding protein [Desulfatiglandales bacterium]
MFHNLSCVKNIKTIKEKIICKKKISFTLNNKPLSIEVDGDRSLLRVLRTDICLTGTKYGCGEGICPDEIP